MRGERILVVGMCNPISDDPRRALWPEPARCTGWNLWKLMEARTGCTPEQYTAAFHRTNMVIGKWHWPTAVGWWEASKDQILEDFDITLLLGAGPRTAAGMGELPELCLRGGIATLPHPSGLNRWYNIRAQKAAAEILMEELYLRAIGE